MITNFALNLAIPFLKGSKDNLIKNNRIVGIDCEQTSSYIQS